MAKNNFLLVDLNETKTKKLAETITSETSRKILNHLTEKDDTEANIAKSLNIPISTVHYHLQKLQDANLVTVEEFHYSKKGREVKHYKLANKYIIIAPKKVSGLKQKLKGILPVALSALGISVIIKLLQKSSLNSTLVENSVAQDMPVFQDTAVESVQAGVQPDAFIVESAQEATSIAIEPLADSAQAQVVQRVVEEAPQIVVQQPDIALWFLIGSFATIVLYIIFSAIRELKEKK